MAFNWNDHPVVTDSPTSPESTGSEPFNWDAHPAETTPYSKLGSAAMGAVNQFNAAPSAVGALADPAGAKLKLMQALVGNPLNSLMGKEVFKLPEGAGQGYDKVREMLQPEFAQARQDNPWSYGLGNAAGGVASAALLPGAATAKTGTEALLNGAELGGQLGVLNATGDAASNDKSVGDARAAAIAQGAGGAILGGALGYGAHKLLPSSLESSASTNAVKTFAPPKSAGKMYANAPLSEDVMDAAGNVVYSAPAGKTYREQLGNVLLDNPFSQGILDMGKGPEGREEALKEGMDKAGQVIDNTISQVDDAGGQFTGLQKVLNFVDDKIKNYSSKSFTDNNGSQTALATSPEDFNLLSNVKNMIQDLSQQGTRDASPNVTYRTAGEIMDHLKDLAYKEGTNGVKNSDISQIRGFMNNLVEGDLQNDAQELFKPDSDVFKNFMDAKEFYRAGKTIQSAAEGASAKDFANRDYGLMDHLMTTAAVNVGGAPAAVPAILLNKSMSNGSYNASLAKAQSGLANVGNTVSDAAANATKKLSSVLTNAAPETYKAWAASLAQSPSPTAQGLGRVFENASTKDQIGRNALMFTVMQNPTYRNLLEGLGSAVGSVTGLSNK